MIIERETRLVARSFFRVDPINPRSKWFGRMRVALIYDKSDSVESFPNHLFTPPRHNIFLRIRDWTAFCNKSSISLSGETGCQWGRREAVFLGPFYQLGGLITVDTMLRSDPEKRLTASSPQLNHQVRSPGGLRACGLFCLHLEQYAIHFFYRPRLCQWMIRSRND